MALPRPSWLGGQGEALPLPAGGAREMQRAPTGSDTFSIPNEVRPHCAAAEQGYSGLPRCSGGFYGLKLAGEDYD